MISTDITWFPLPPPPNKRNITAFPYFFRSSLAPSRASARSAWRYRLRLLAKCSKFIFIAFGAPNDDKTVEMRFLPFLSFANFRLSLCLCFVPAERYCRWRAKRKRKLTAFLRANVYGRHAKKKHSPTADRLTGRRGASQIDETKTSNNSNKKCEKKDTHSIVYIMDLLSFTSRDFNSLHSFRSRARARSLPWRIFHFAHQSKLFGCRFASSSAFWSRTCHFPHLFERFFVLVCLLFLRCSTFIFTFHRQRARTQTKRKHNGKYN